MKSMVLGILGHSFHNSSFQWEVFQRMSGRFWEKVLQLLLALIVFTLFVVFTQAEAATVAWGSKGEQVRLVQEKLKQYGYFKGTVDGVFGTGFHGALPIEIQTLLEKIHVPVVAIDLPSGMDGMSGVCAPGTLKPVRTVTFAYQKPCHLLADCGKVV